jgi:hypothetical protein
MHRFTSTEDTNSHSFVIYDRGDTLQPKTEPDVWAIFPVYDRPGGRELAEKRCLFLTGVLNGIRQVSEQVDVA